MHRSDSSGYCCRFRFWILSRGKNQPGISVPFVFVSSKTMLFPKKTSNQHVARRSPKVLCRAEVPSPTNGTSSHVCVIVRRKQENTAMSELYLLLSSCSWVLSLSPDGFSFYQAGHTLMNFCHFRETLDPNTALFQPKIQ